MTPAAAPAWSDTAVRRLLDTVTCPVCETGVVDQRRCPHCGADFRGDIGGELWDASQHAVSALRTRQEVLERVPQAAPEPVAAAVARPTSGAAAAGTEPPVALRPAGPSATVQSVLAVAGAGLFAVAAVVFTFFNPDLTDHGVRTAVVAVITLVFLVGARLLGRRGLRFSAEAVGGLGMVFLGLDVYAFADLAPAAVSPWAFAALGTLVAGTAMTALAVRFRLRVWLWTSLLGLALVPAMLGLASDTALAAVLGWLGTGFAAFGLIEATRPLVRRLDSALQTERVTLTVVALLTVAVVAARLSGIELAATWARWVTVASVLAAVTALALLCTRQLVPRLWSAIAGTAGAAAIVALPLALTDQLADMSLWLFLVVPAAAVLGALVLGALLPLPRTAVRPFTAGGALAVAGAASLPPLFASLAVGASTLLAETDSGFVLDRQLPSVVLGLAAVAAGLGGFATLRRDPRHPAATRWIGELGAWFAVASALTLVCWPAIAVWGRVALALALAGGASAALVLAPRLRAAVAAQRLPLIVGAHLAIVLAVVMSWRVDALVVWAGVAVLVTSAVAARTVPASGRFLHVGVGYAYALLVFARGLDILGVGTIPLLCLTTSLAALGAIASTYLRVVGPRAWWAILAVTSVPFVLGVVQVVFERSGWTALSTGLIFLLALALLLTRRPGLGLLLRTIAAGLLVPSIAVVIVCLGAQLLVDSGSPVVLPVIAAIVALVLPSTGLIRTALVGRGLTARDTASARLAIEASALVTAAIAVGLGLVRDAAGLGTTCLVLLILGVGAVAAAVWGGRRYGWWMAGAAFTGALWCAWGLAGVDLPEPYVLPPAVAAAVVGAILTARGARAVPLYASGLAVAVVPVLVLLAVVGTPAETVWRAYGLLAASWLLLGAGTLAGRLPRVRALRIPTFAAAIVAGAAGAVQGVRLGLGLDPFSGGMPLVLVCASLALLGAVPAFAAARGLRAAAAPGSRPARSRWLAAPATLYLAAGTWTAIERDWLTIWTMWALMLAYLVAVVAVAWRFRARATSLPPVWFVFAIAFVTAIVAWSPRDLRVEWFSLPLGLFLLAAGALHLRIVPHARASLQSWPAGFTGSWPLLAPGLVVMFSASMTATFTDPLTWRAILVIVIALLAILAGAGLKLAAPFVIGIVVLPVENVLVFLVQIGRGIASMPWWITLAVVGAVLLIIAVTYERRAAGDAGIAARLRDLA